MLLPDDAAAHDALPNWERRYPGRLQYELDELRRKGVEPEINHEALRTGVLVITLIWRLGATSSAHLRAVYPDSFPSLRPEVYLLEGPADLPPRHRNPREGNICLLGRDTRQWLPSWSLAELISLQLNDALYGTGEEDPQGEPADVWWNSLGLRGACALVDSAWTLGDSPSGTLKFQFAVEEERATDSVPIIRGVVTEVHGSENELLHRWEGSIPFRETTKSAAIPWVRLNTEFLPRPDWQKQVKTLIQERDLKRTNIVKQARMAVVLYVVAHPIEIEYKKLGVGWGFIQFTGKKNKKGKITRGNFSIIPVFRAGSEDLSYRVPAVKLLREKRILVVGTGAIGSTVAIELARNSCGALHLLDYDLVEPGNTVRWPLGTSAWGRSKISSLQGFIEREYPSTNVFTYDHQIGLTKGDDAVLDPIIKDVNLIIDASTSYGVVSFLSERCRSIGIPLISFFATPSLAGGAVIRFGSAGGCPCCLEHAWGKGDIYCPPGYGEEDGLMQPPGCAERTFTGASYDLKELSLQAVRLAVSTLQEEARDSIVQVLRFVDETGHRIPPIWSGADLPKHTDCGCLPNAQ